ncbi:hypothetical protein [Paeniglutamicibacter terrestris]|uniref:Calcineurin-like phosphoesterase domain-containing protein n=1 Tax=Paeniglutamicibacter terrestris TaxID=2723403 RepID=A0ABX1G6P5_9MICC|nr:hypothetical protein [Paeniglutamicibacter terrestris]NKG21092.1 hypothetical protein [Paeniglutamicibacter terrestris]
MATCIAASNPAQASGRSARRHRAGQCACANTTDTANPMDPTTAALAPYEAGTNEGTNQYTTMSEKPWGYEDFCKFIADKGQDPETLTFAWGVTSNPHGGFWNKIWGVRPKTAKDSGDPLWPVIQPAQPVIVKIKRPTVQPVRTMKLAMKGADTQIGFRRLADGTMDPFHDDAAMAVFVEACAHFQPDVIQILGDFLDFASQGRFAQEAGFALTTQASLDRGHLFLAILRAACPNARIVIIEGNHDKRMQNFVEANALAAFGLKRAGLPESWPVMSLPYLLRLDELNIQYVDAYPAATDWDNDLTRNIHGTKANSKGSTTAQYVTDLPHINTWAGHTHRTEITYKSVLGARGETVESYSANPGCLCRTDGAVPSVHGAIGADGTAARIVEDWQQGFGMAYYNDTESWPFVYRIRNGRALIGGQEIAA